MSPVMIGSGKLRKKSFNRAASRRALVCKCNSSQMATPPRSILSRKSRTVRILAHRRNIPWVCGPRRSRPRKIAKMVCGKIPLVHSRFNGIPHIRFVDLRNSFNGLLKQSDGNY